ncbi:methyl-accepting chemotaxis protein [Tistrella mobilis]|uniref:methyl-accepting chemotaxis protein n=1 Tax=Tistrella mobilis TaxID=171437 RepID=UPI0035564E33
MVSVLSGRLTSVQARIALTAGLCLATTVAVLVGFSLVSARNTHDYVTEGVLGIVDGQTKAALQNRAATEAAAIKAQLDAGLDTARTLARSFAVLATDGPAGTPAGQRRDQLNTVLREALAQDPALNGTYSAWEPDALDGADASFRGDREQGSDATGRFLPYWTRSADGRIAIQPLVEYDSSDRHPNGLVKGGWYIGPAETGRENILGPLPYIVQGKPVFLATLSAPIMIDGRFRGVAGTDYNLDFIQALAVKVSNALYDGRSRVAIISDAGLIVADSGAPETIGQPVTAAGDSWTDGLEVIRAGEATVLDRQGHPDIDVFSPIRFGDTATPWSVVISVPRDVALASVNALSGDMAERSTRDTLVSLGVGFAVVLGAILVVALAARGIARPIRACAGFADGIAEGRFDQSLTVDQKDEVGRLATALTRMQGDLRRNIAQRAEDQAAAEAARRQAMRDMADRFEASVGGVLNGVTSAATELRSTAETMTVTADETSRRSTAAASATEQASQNIQTVAAAAEQLSAAIGEIGDRVNQSSGIVGEAVRQADATGLRVKNLSEAAQKVGNVVQLINDIASQTNLLALNATIEAARAGEAGKGFAVVASEVKTLAVQTARATEEIAAQIRSIQDATRDSAHAIEEIGATINRVNEISTAISAAMQEQGAATREISRNVQEASQGTVEVTGNIGSVTAAARETDLAANQVLSAAGDLGRNGEDLRRQVEDFLQTVRA